MGKINVFAETLKSSYVNMNVLDRVVLYKPRLEVQFRRFHQASFVESIHMFKTRVLTIGINPEELRNKDSLLKPSISVRNTLPGVPPTPWGGGTM